MRCFAHGSFNPLAIDLCEAGEILPLGQELRFKTPIVLSLAACFLGAFSR